MIALTRAALARLPELVPGSEGRFVLAGFGWHQGWNDRVNDKFTAEYEVNLAHFIRDVRREDGAALAALNAAGLAFDDPAMRRAWLRSGLRVPFHIAVHVPALAICLRHLAGSGMQRKRVARA